MSVLTDRCDEAVARAIRDAIEVDPKIDAVANTAINLAARAARIALLSELDAAGWQTVPKVATDEMKVAGGQALSGWIAPAMHSDVSYAAMLAAAPHPFPEGKP